MERRRFLTLMAASAAGAAAPRSVFAQKAYPIRLIAPSPPGGVHYVVGRVWAAHVEPLLGTVVVENHPGAGALIGANDVAKSKPDGYTLLLGSTSSQIISPAVAPSSPYNPLKDFATVTVLTTSATSIVVNPSVPAKSLQELIAYAKANPGKLSYGSAGVGSTSHLTGELFKQLAGGLDIVHVPYKGAAPSLSDLMSGQVLIATPNATGQVLQLHQAGNIRVLAINSPDRLKAAPDIPTAIEQGLPDMISLFFCGLFAPAATPRPIVDQLNEATQEVLRKPEVEAMLSKLGYEPLLGFGPDKGGQFVESEYRRWTPIARASVPKAG